MVLLSTHNSVRRAFDDVQRHPDHGARVAHRNLAISEAACRTTTSQPQIASTLLDEAGPHRESVPKARLIMQRGLIDLYRGALHDALHSLHDAAGPLRDAGDDVARCRLLANRGIVHTNLDQLELGSQDFIECRRLAVELDLAMLAAGAAHSLGFVASRRGDFPTAFTWFERARSEYQLLGFPLHSVAVLDSDMCAALLSAGLFGEAHSAAHRAAAAARRSKSWMALGDALLLVAQTSLARNDPEAARAAARESSQILVDSNREPLAALARYFELRSEVSADFDAAPPCIERAEAILELLDRHGWGNEANDVRIFIGRLALDQGDRVVAERHLAAAAEGRRSGQWPRRVGGWLALALLRRSRGDDRSAKRALTAAFQIVDAHQATLAASDLRAHVASHSTAVVELGLEIARTTESSADMLLWAERHHARSMQLTPVKRRQDIELSVLLRELRTTHATAARAVAAGHCDPESDARIQELERRIRHQTRTSEVDGDHHHGRVRGLDVDAAFEDRALIEHVRCGTDLIAITAFEGRLATHVVGDHRHILGLQRHAIAALRRLAFGGRRLRALAAAAENLAAISAELDELLIRPLRLPAGMPTVIVPTGEMLSLPWSMLPSLRTRSWALAPSATLSSRPSRRADSDAPRALLISGPGLEHADAEVAKIGATYNEPVILTSENASVDRIVTAMADADIVHIAAHGRFRADSPLFSSIELADGPVTVYDLEHVARPPRVVVLSACDAGRVAVRGGDELLGTGAALLQLGVGAIVAPVTAVPDQAVVPLMHDLHRGLHRGLDAASALRLAQAKMFSRGSHSDIAAAGSFVVMAGDRSTPRDSPLH